MNDPQLTQIVAGCVLRQNDKYLLVQEKKESAYGLWNLPSGRLAIGETFEAAAIREVFEETGFKVKIIKKLRVEHAKPQQPVLHSFEAEITEGSLVFPKDELLDARWFSYEEIKRLYKEGKVRAEWVFKSIEDING